jgi:hypothetical protein
VPDGLTPGEAITAADAVDAVFGNLLGFGHRGLDGGESLRSAGNRSPYTISEVDGETTFLA